MAQKVKEWITVNGQHIPIMEGQTKQEAVNKAIKHQESSKGDADHKERQIEMNHNEASVQNMIQDKEFAKLGKFLSEHRKEYGLKKSEDTYMVAYDVINKNRELKGIDKDITKDEASKDAQISKNEFEIQNGKYGPSADDITTSGKEYFKDTSVKVNTSLANWKEEVDKKGIPDSVNDYMVDSSLNDTLRSGGQLKGGQRQQLESLDNFTTSSSVPAGTMLYSGITSAESLRFWEGKKEIKYPAFLSTSPDPVYARGYGMNTNTMLQIECSKDTKIGKTYYQDSTGTEGILGRNRTYQIIGESEEMVDGDKVKLIKVRI